MFKIISYFIDFFFLFSLKRNKEGYFIRKVLERGNYYLGKTKNYDQFDLEVKYVKTFLNEKNLNICIDIGGHRGDYSKELLRNFDIKQLIIFEPSYENYKYLKTQFNDNNIRLENLAVSSTSGNQTFYYHNHNSSLSSLHLRNIFKNDKNINSYEVEVVSLQEYLKKNQEIEIIDLIKIDIEGNEYEAIKGLGSSIKMVRVIQFEFGSTFVDTKIPFFQFWTLLTENGFEIFRMGPVNLFEVKSYSIEEEFIEYSNFIAVNKKYI